MIFAAILAGGIGSRMNISDMPKQFLPLDSKPIVIHTLEKFLTCGRFDAVYVGVHPDWLLYMQDLINNDEHLSKADVKVVAGGQDRNSTIFNIIENIEKEYRLSDDDVIVTHDSVRPFVTLRMIEENIDAAIKYGACDTVIPSTDTIVASRDGITISSAPDRSELYQGQTPQSFKVNLLKNLYMTLKDDEKKTLTDACKIFVLRDYPVYLVKGEVSNMKLTTISDYKVAQALIGGDKVD